MAALLADGVIEGSCSPWASPVVLVKKKNGEWRFCIDYRHLNSVTAKDSHPLPRVDQTLDALEGSLWFITLDFSNGYWQVNGPGPLPVAVYADGPYQLTCNLPAHDGAGAQRAPMAGVYGAPLRTISPVELNPKKCHLARDHVVFLGHVVSRHGLQPDPRNTDKVRTWPTPKNPTEVRAFVGLCS